jgi:pseudouridine kinase
LESPQRNFFRCGFCGFSWVDPRFLVDEETSRRRYLLHRNNHSHEGYTRFLSSIIERALTYTGAQKNMKILDWGSGPHPVTASILAHRGFEAVSWDPFFANEHTPEQEAFDMALCIETAEHFIKPRQDFSRFARCLKPGGWAFIHTHTVSQEDGDFLRWWYIQDCTHVSFYSEKSLEILAAMNSLSFVVLEGGKLAVLRRPLPVLVVGGINQDIEARTYNSLLPHDSNPGTLHFSPGGCGRNIAENLSRLGMGTEFAGAVGDDVFGAGLRESSKSLGIGISGLQVIMGKTTSAYVSRLDPRGDMAAAVSAMALFDCFTPEAASAAVEQAAVSGYGRSFGGNPAAPFSAVLLDGNLLPETLLFIRRRFPDLPCWLDPVSGTKMRRLADYGGGIGLAGLEGIKLNFFEAQELLGIAVDPENPVCLERLFPKIKERLNGTSIVYITLGGGGVVRIDRLGAVWYKVPEIEPVSATGAGDAFLAAAVRQRILGGPDRDPDKLADLAAGTAGAYLTLQSPQTVSSALTGESLELLILTTMQKTVQRPFHRDKNVYIVYQSMPIK